MMRLITKTLLSLLMIPLVAVPLSILGAYGQTENQSPSLEQAITLYEAGKLTEVIAVCDNVISNDPINSQAFNLRGVAKFRTGTATLGIEDFRRAIELNRYIGESFFHLGVIELITESMNVPIKGCVNIEKAQELGYHMPDYDHHLSWKSLIDHCQYQKK